MNILHVGLIKLRHSLCVRCGVCDRNNSLYIPESSFPCGLSTHRYVGCCSFSVLHVNKDLPRHYLIRK